MKLFQALFRRRNLPNGDIHRGKQRLEANVTRDHINIQRKQFEVEEKNMFLLRHPYLTLEQSHGHSLALGKAQTRMDKMIGTKKPFKEHVTLESRLGHLRHKECWD